ncbi:Flagellar M-ring protein FliF [Euzebya pacifica]|uniref:Flagellar M-ring protein n=1 Tax=Euzebya pacifica TaxID=1608957 RepID=A0A346XUH9_9ACTN|nr:flagellar basal-body MS-ring/collar protein FliF [Euzebya pacifica]AXV05876.1 Flagellar M-ring protein FliF [Euzebya pacifica]
MADTTTRERSPQQLAEQARDKANGILSGFTTGQKTTTALAIIALLAAGMFFMRWVSEPSMAPLFTNLEAEDAAAITDELTARGVDYQLSDGGRTVMVPRSDQLGLRLDMSSAGLVPSNTAGYSLLDENGITTSEFQMRVDYQRAVEGELSRTISAMEAVESAMVHLVIPEEDLFVQDNERATASVLLNTMGDLTPMQVQAIVNLVSGSVQGLTADQVTVTDASGNLLHQPGEDGTSAAAGDMRQYQTSTFESRLAADVETMLQQVVGPNNAVVTVTADLNFDRIQQTTETFGNAAGGVNGIPLESTTTTESYEGVGAPSVGVLGPDGQPLVGAEGETTNYTLSDGSTRFAVDRSVQDILSAPGSVDRLSVAVLLDANREGADAAQVQALVEAAVGFDAVRGDVIEVSALPFDATAAEDAAAAAEEAAAAAGQERMFDLIRTIGSVLIVMIVLFLAWRSARKSLPQRQAETIPLDLASLEAGSDDDAAEVLSDEELNQLEAGPDLTDEVTSLIDGQGDDMAGLLRGWMSA